VTTRKGRLECRDEGVRDSDDNASDDEANIPSSKVGALVVHTKETRKAYQTEAETHSTAQARVVFVVLFVLNDDDLVNSIDDWWIADDWW